MIAPKIRQLWTGIGTHPVMAFGAIVVGWAAYRLIWIALQQLPLLDWLVDPIIRTVGSHPFGMFWAQYLWFRPVDVVAYLLSGFVVGRLHRRHRTAMVFAFAVTLFVINAVRVASLFRTDFVLSQHVRTHWWLDVLMLPLTFAAMAGAYSKPKSRIPNPNSIPNPN